ncbi:MAG: transcriptional repressor [Bacteroidetes bacterium]|nr:transcriptional repressor [Bacteroidota bacterium]HET6242957.1 transcriptional repressor [Bacteroidia bacterium]
MEKTIEITKLLEKYKLQKTPCRKSILNLFLNTAHALSHQDIVNGLKTEFDRVTIYRTFNSFEGKGMIHKVIDSEGTAKYALCAHDCTSEIHNDSHLHFSCSKCQKTICIENCKIPEIKIPEGFQLQKLSLLAEGICKSCKK